MFGMNVNLTHAFNTLRMLNLLNVMFYEITGTYFCWGSFSNHLFHCNSDGGQSSSSPPISFMSRQVGFTRWCTNFLLNKNPLLSLPVGFQQWFIIQILALIGIWVEIRSVSRVILYLDFVFFLGGVIFCWTDEDPVLKFFTIFHHHLGVANGSSKTPWQSPKFGWNRWFWNKRIVLKGNFLWRKNEDKQNRPAISVVFIHISYLGSRMNIWF